METLPDGKLVHQGWSPQCESGPAVSDGDWGALKTTAIQDGTYLPEHNKRLPDSFEPKPRLEVLPGDVLLTCAGPRARCGVACLVRATPRRRFISGKMYRFRANPELLDPRYLEAFLRTPETKAQIDAMKTGISESGMNITHERFAQLLVPLPPREEQRRIADKLDTMLARVDACRDRLARVAPLLKRFRQSVLADATSGRLTVDWRSEAGGRSLSAWQSTSIGALSNVVRGASPRPAGDPRYFGGACPWITVGELTKDERKFLDETRLFVTEAGKERSRYIAAGTLLLTNSGATLGVPKITKIGGCINDGSVALLGVVEPLRSFLYWLLRGKTEALRALNQGAAQPNLNTSIVKAIVVHLPPTDEQAEIVRRVETLFAFADRLEVRLAQALTAVDRLTPSLLAKAFRGELVPQDPTDEPAAELLKRLAASRAAPAPKARRGRQAQTA